MPDNIYNKHIRNFFSKLVELRHGCYQISNLLIRSKKDVEVMSGVDIVSGSHLIISDWSGPTAKGWTINRSTGFSKSTLRLNYSEEISRLISFECCFTFVQSFEALERLFKDLVYEKTKFDPAYKCFVKNNMRGDVKREILPGGESLFKFIKHGGGAYFKSYSHKNNVNIRFKELWTVLSEARHAITHSSSRIKVSKVKRSQYYQTLYNYCFVLKAEDGFYYEIIFDYKDLSKSNKIVAEIGFQIYKAFSCTSSLEWDILRK